jgi:hypothetical protein
MHQKIQPSLKIPRTSFYPTGMLRASSKSWITAAMLMLLSVTMLFKMHLQILLKNVENINPNLSIKIKCLNMGFSISLR